MSQDIFGGGDDFDEEEAPSFDTPAQAQRGTRSRYEQKYGVGRGDLWREHFGFLGNWKQILLLLGVLGVAIIIFVLRFGTNPATIVDRIKANLGIPIPASPGRVLSDSNPYAIHLRYANGNQTQTGTAHIIGVAPVRGHCGAGVLHGILPPSSLVSVTFNPTLGQTDSSGHLLVSIDYHGQDVGRELLRDGGATLDSSTAGAAKLLASYKSAEDSAKHNHAGYWSCH